MRPVYITLLTLFLGAATTLAQSPHRLLISGHVTGKDTATKLSHVIIHLKDDSGGIYETRTDTNGFYRFEFEKARFKNAEISCAIDKQVKPNRKMTECGQYIASADKGLVRVTDSINVFTKDFELIRSNGGCDYFPGFHFNKNSTTYRSSADKSYSHFDSAFADPNTALVFLVKTLLDNPGIVIEISAHCSAEETSPGTLSQQRAEKVKSDFVKAGVDKHRLVAKGYGIQKLLVNPISLTKRLMRRKKKSWTRRTGLVCLR